MSQPARAVWIEIVGTVGIGLAKSSQPARAVWIEIVVVDGVKINILVTACEGCVD